MSAFETRNWRGKVPSVDDLEYVASAVDWSPLTGKNVLITGDNGFIGNWMTSSLTAAQHLGKSQVENASTTRRAEDFWPSDKPDYIIHATKDSIGWDNILNIARVAKAKMLLLSSGAVYGAITSASESKPFSDEDLPTGAAVSIRQGIRVNEYASAKRWQEEHCQDVATIARLFSFIGPGLRRHTGAEFLEADPITVNDDGAVRSYMYASDMAVWLWTILLHGQVGRAYNVGSKVHTQITTFAQTCAAIRNVRCLVNKSDQTGTYYVPDTTRAEKELELRQTVFRGEAIEKTLAWQQGV